MPATPGRRSHDDVGHATTSLLAALDMATDTVIGSLHRRHRASEFKKFLGRIEEEVPDHLQVHLILDSYSTHKTPEVRRWLERHPRFHLHFTPTSGSWLNMVERWFGELTTKKIDAAASVGTYIALATANGWSTRARSWRSPTGGRRPPWTAGSASGGPR